MSNLEPDYTPLWTMLIRNNMTKRELSIKCGIYDKTLFKLKNNKPLHLKVLLRICKGLGCRISDIVRAGHNNIISPPADTEHLKLDYSGIYELMKKYKLSEFEFGKRTGLGYMTLQKIKNSEPIHLTAVLRICECFECEIEDIVEVSG